MPRAAESTEPPTDKDDENSDYDQAWYNEWGEETLAELQCFLLIDLGLHDLRILQVGQAALVHTCAHVSQFEGFPPPPPVPQV